LKGRHLLVKLSQDLTQVLYLVDDSGERAISYEPPGFEPVLEFKIPEDGPRWLRGENARKVYLHPSVRWGSARHTRIGDVLEGDGNEGH